jgi:hypothetical protein
VYNNRGVAAPHCDWLWRLLTAAASHRLRRLATPVPSGVGRLVTVDEPLRQASDGDSFRLVALWPGARQACRDEDSISRSRATRRADRRSRGSWRATPPAASLREFAPRHGISTWTLYCWRRRLAAKPSAPPAREPQLVAVDVVGLDRRPKELGYEIVLPGGACLRVSRDFEAAPVAAFVVVVRGC